MTKKLTVAIPTYNRALTIIETLDSILNQVNNNVEVIICDNGSTDNTKRFFNRILHQKRVGILVQVKMEEWILISLDV